MRDLTPPRGPALLPPGYWGGALQGLAVLVVLAAFCGWVWSSPENLVDVGDPERVAGIVGWIGVGIGVVALVLLGVILLGGNRVPRYAADAEGIAVWHRWGHAEVPWSHVVAVGIGWQRPPFQTSFTHRRDHAVEIFVVDDDPAVVFPHLSVLLVTESPPVEGLPERRIRIVVPRRKIEALVERDVRAYAAPDTWIGTYKRAWDPIPGV